MPNNTSDDDLSHVLPNALPDALPNALPGKMVVHSLFAERKLPRMTNTAFVLRMTWDAESRHWLVLFKPTDGGQARVFADLESARLYIARLYPNAE